MKLCPYTMRHVAAEYMRRYRSHTKMGWGCEFEKQQAEYWSARARNLTKRRGGK